jgi:hypothetical protein
VLDMGTVVFARRARWVDGGVFTRTSKGIVVAKAGGHRFSTATSKDRGIRRCIQKTRNWNVVYKWIEERKDSK